MTNELTGPLPDNADDLPPGHPAEPTRTVAAGEVLSQPVAAMRPEVGTE